MEKGKAALAKLGATPAARVAKARTPREQGYLRAVEALFGPADKSARASAHAKEMARVAAENPADDDAQTFYALALLATLPRGDAALPLRQQAGAIAEKVFARNPKHPGAAHYILHAYDHGTLASEALPAARAYAKIAPQASHALHMPAHTFLQLGFWDEAAAADEASWNASIAWAKRRGLPITSRDFHSLSWLQYEWTQQGDSRGRRRRSRTLSPPSPPRSLRRLRRDRLLWCHHNMPVVMGTVRAVRSAGGTMRPHCVTIVVRCARATSSRASAGRK